MARCSATILLNERNMEDAQNAAQRYPTAIPVAADIRKEYEVEAMFEKILQQIDGIYGLVNNAGIGLYKRAHEVKEEEFDGIHDTDIKGLW